MDWSELREHVVKLTQVPKIGHGLRKAVCGGGRKPKQQVSGINPDCNTCYPTFYPACYSLSSTHKLPFASVRCPTSRAADRETVFPENHNSIRLKLNISTFYLVYINVVYNNVRKVVQHCKAKTVN